MNRNSIMVGACALIIGFAVGRYLRPSVSSPGVKAGGDGMATAPIAGPGKTEPSPQSTNPAPHAPTLNESIAAAPRSQRLAGLISLITSAKSTELAKLTSKLKDSLRDGLLSPDDFVVAVECLGERGSTEVAAMLLNGKSATGPHREAISLYFRAWSRADAGAAWSFARKHFEGRPAEKIQIHPPAMSPFPENVLQGLVQGTQDRNSPEFFAIHKGAPPLADKFAMWQMESLVRSAGFGGAVAAVKKEVSGKPAEQLAFNKIAAISDAALAAGSEAIRETAAILTGAGNIAPGVFPEPTAHLATEYARIATEEAFEWANSLPAGTSQRSIALSSAVFQMGMKDADKALEWVRNLPSASREEEVNLALSLNNAFRQSPRLSDEERKELLDQTGPMVEQLRPKRNSR